jgi:nucleoside-diphosphate-sugar epimerase
MKALVTGAGGTIGSRLCRRLLDRGDAVRGLFLPDEPLADLEGVEVARGDITRPETLDGVAKDIDCVFHLAARVADWGSMDLFRSIMAQGTANLLEQCVGKVDRFVHVSSIAAYGFGRHMKGFTEDAPQVLCGVPYADTKIYGEMVVKGYTFGTDTSYTIIRPANVLGPRSVWVTDVVDAYLRGPVPLCDGGRYSTSFVYVDNLVDGVVLAADSEKARGRAYNFRDDYKVTWKEYVQQLGSIIGKKPMGSLPTRVAWAIGHLTELAYAPFFPARPPFTRLAVGVMGYDNDVDTTRAREDLGWSTGVSYEEAMAAVEAFVHEYITGK